MTADRDEYDEVIAALDRLADGSFARCAVCGTQVDGRQLRLTLAANRCRRHLTSPPPAPGATP